MTRHLVRLASTAAATTAVLCSLVNPSTALAQAGVGASLTPYAGYLVTGNWYDGPLGTSLSTTNAPMVGVNGAVPLTKAYRWWGMSRMPPATCG